MEELNSQVSRYFHGSEGYNCYQAVLKILQLKNPSLNISEDDINEGRKFGGGKAPEGLCGALYAILTQVKDNSEKEKFIKLFSQNFSNEFTCKGIRQNTKTNCKDCVLHALKIYFES